jgi:hypothetical protein
MAGHFAWKNSRCIPADPKTLYRGPLLADFVVKVACDPVYWSAGYDSADLLGAVLGLRVAAI